MKLQAALITAMSAAAALAWAPAAQAHCDTLDGPVVSAARSALDTGNVNLVLVWIQKSDEPEIRSAFERSRNVRRAGGEAKNLADTYFFETLVRVHRAGEGAAQRVALRWDHPLSAQDEPLGVRRSRGARVGS